MRVFSIISALALALALAACGSMQDDKKTQKTGDKSSVKEETKEQPKPAPKVRSFQENIDHFMQAQDVGAKHVEVAHILVKKEHRGMSQAESRAHAEEIYNLLMAGGDWEELKAEHTEDPGSKARGKGYTMHDDRAGVIGTDGSFPRSGMVKYFGDVSFRLEVGEIGVAPYHAQHSVHGWHIIKRVK